MQEYFKRLIASACWHILRLTFKRTLPGRENKKQELPSTLARLGKQADDLEKKLLTCKNDVPERAIRAPYPYILCGTTLLSGALADGAPLMAGLLTIGVLEIINQVTVAHSSTNSFMK